MMKPYHDLTYQGRVRRMRRLAETALAAFGISDARFKLLRQAGNTQPYHLQAQGRLLARLHNFAAQWQPPAGGIKRHFDWDGLFQNDVGSGMPNAEAWALLSPVHREAFDFVAQHVRKVMDAWGKGSDVYGLIHGDLGIDANLLFWQGKPRAIDFDDSGFGYWIFGLAVGLDFCWDDAAFPRYREALLNGYTGLRSLPEEQVEYLEFFLAALQVYWNLWATGGTHLYPDLLKYYDERIAHTAERVVRYVQRIHHTWRPRCVVL